MARRKKMGFFEAIICGLVAGAVKGVKSPSHPYKRSRYTTRKRRTKSWI